ncbi:hypothetical protein ACOMICROBIO_GDFFDHBD_01522 [Vibrio sp. B1REV9]|uniref:hypothetical protein n=1 Tax=Vibrio sp. B1REV9 TaxID=2751179 RepID=UPI001AF31203|nr:hypothetical protein [Vibrio sp. B1REV9]CAE6901050.1 hypothetical protein ACOMICROBIO_GDFFDHBD_01522 [Vibrio sp. B1REV9]
MQKQITINFTNEMIEQSIIQTKKRNPDLKPHFENLNMTKEQGHQIGFLGEFAACVYFGLDWLDNIRSDYKTIDTHDLTLGNAKVDVKTESVPDNIFQMLQTQFRKRPFLQHGSIFDDKPYGRRLINAGQRQELEKKHVVLFGAVNRDSMIEHEDGTFLIGLSGWLPLGYVTVKNALKYPIIEDKPFVAKKHKYPTPVMAIKSSDLLSIDDLKEKYNQHKNTFQS